MRSKTTTENCGTCEYWTGGRMPVFDGKGNPALDITERYGDCRNVNSRFCDQRRERSSKCKHFSKWTEIL